jgi:hypothetical protein
MVNSPEESTLNTESNYNLGQRTEGTNPHGVDLCLGNSHCGRTPHQTHTITHISYHTTTYNAVPCREVPHSQTDVPYSPEHYLTVLYPTLPSHFKSHHATPHHTTPHQTTPHHTTPHHATQNHTTPHLTPLRHTTPHHTTPNHTTTHHTTTHHTIPHHTAPHHTLQYFAYLYP